MVQTLVDKQVIEIKRNLLLENEIEGVEKVCDVVKLFIETGQVAANKDLHIPLNKKLRNAELKQFVTNRIKV